jgi:glycosyltransferase involved in cell wall biosynthesis
VRLSIVAPCHNEEHGIDALHEAVVDVVADLAPDWELVLVDDGSTDATLARLRDLAERDPHVRYVSLSRNFGKESALLAGLRASTGDAVVTMDADLQHPPSLIPRLVSLYLDGYDHVATRRTREGDPWVRRITGRAYYAVVNRFISVRLDDGVGDFRLLSRRAVDGLLALPEENRFSKGLFAWIGYAGPVVEYRNEQRSAGSSSWSLSRLFEYGVDGVLSFNAKPLRVVLWVGLTVFLLSCAYIVVVLVSVATSGVDAPGYASLVIAVLGLGGVQLVALGVLGEYVGRIYVETKRRPHYLVRETNIDGSPESRR